MSNNETLERTLNELYQGVQQIPNFDPAGELHPSLGRYSSESSQSIQEADPTTVWRLHRAVTNELSILEGAAYEVKEGRTPNLSKLGSNAESRYAIWAEDMCQYMMAAIHKVRAGQGDRALPILIRLANNLAAFQHAQKIMDEPGKSVVMLIEQAHRGTRAE